MEGKPTMGRGKWATSMVITGSPGGILQRLRTGIIQSRVVFKRIFTRLRNPSGERSNTTSESSKSAEARNPGTTYIPVQRKYSSCLHVHTVASPFHYIITSIVRHGLAHARHLQSELDNMGRIISEHATELHRMLLFDSSEYMPFTEAHVDCVFSHKRVK